MKPRFAGLPCPSFVSGAPAAVVGCLVVWKGTVHVPAGSPRCRLAGRFCYCCLAEHVGVHDVMCLSQPLPLVMVFAQRVVEI